MRLIAVRAADRRERGEWREERVEWLAIMNSMAW